ncbi:MAG: class I SAM-dependent DNA methyltransferase [Alkalispirochaeta sp.]
MADTVPYRHLSTIYDGGWSDYSEYIHHLIREIERESRRNFRSVCDAACGTGLLMQLLRNDTIDREVLGYDRSPEMIALARERNGDDRVVRGDLRDPIPVAGPFDLITCVYDSLNYLTEPDEIGSFLAAARERIAGDGLLLVDFNSRELYERRRGQRRSRLVGGVPFRETLSFDPGPPPVATTTFEFDDASETHIQRPWDPDEVEELMATTGWKEIDALDVVDEENDEASGKIVYLAVPAEHSK